MKKANLFSIKLFIVVMVFVLLSSLAFAEIPKVGGILTVGIGRDVDDLNPQTASTGANFWVLDQIYSGLYRLNASLEPVPDLAKEVTISEDDLVWTFKIYEGVKFHDGSDLTAEDIKFTYDAVRDPKSKSNYWSEWTDVSKIEVVDDYTVRFTLKNPIATFKYLLIPRMGAIVSSDSTSEELGKHPNGTGPFKFVERVSGLNIVLEKNENYFIEGKPYVDKLVFQIIPESTTKITALKTGEVQWIDSVPFQMFEKLRADDSIKFLDKESTWYEYISMNCRKAPFDKIPVRQAMAYALNYQDIIKGALYGQGVTGNNSPLPTVFPICPKVEGFIQDQEKAKNLLAEAGYDESNPLKFNLLVLYGFPEMMSLAEIMKSQLGEIGVTANISVSTPGVFLDTKNYEMYISGIIFGEDPDAKLYRYFLSTAFYNLSGYKNAAMDLLLDGGRRTSNFEDRYDIYTAAVMILQREVPWIIPYYRKNAVAMKTYVKGYEIMANFDHYFGNTWIDK